MCLRLPGDEFIPIFRGQVDLSRDLIPIGLLVMARGVDASYSRTQRTAIFLLALSLEWTLLRVRRFSDLGVGPLVVLLLLDGLYRIWLAPSGATEGCPVGLNRS